MTSVRTEGAVTSPATHKIKPVKCVVWDLDETLWVGTLLEDGIVRLRPEARVVLETLDARGILHSIASRNERDDAIRMLKEFEIDQLFLHPQINWGSKAESIKTISRKLNIGIDSLLFIDDQAFERDEARFVLPELRTIDASAVSLLLDQEEVNPSAISNDAKYRRRRYQADIERQAAEDAFVGPNEEFLASLEMTLTLHLAGEEDLMRAEELTVRTNQLNATGITYSYSELDQFRGSSNHRLVIAELSDCYGSYGKIGLALVECEPSAWTIRLLLMSCRVMARGVGTVVLREIVERAYHAKVALFADFVATSRNRMMYVTYQFAGFSDFVKMEDRTLLRHDGRPPAARPSHVRVNAAF